MTKAERFWDRQASQFDRQAENGDATNDKAVAHTMKHLTGSDLVLDYACGTGLATLQMADSVQAIQAIDFSAEMIAIAQSNAAERSITNVDFTQAMIDDEALTEGGYDVVLAFNVLHLLEDAPQVVQRINALLKPGGLFISTTPCLGEDRKIFGVVLSILGKIGLVPSIKIFSIAELEAVIGGGDFQLLETEQLSAAPSNYYVVAQKR